MRQAENRVRIEGILAESDLKYISYTKNGEPAEAIGGLIKVLVEQEVNGEPVKLEIPVHAFSTKLTKAGKPNPSYESIEKVMTEFVSIAAAGSAAQADKIRITNGNIKMNEFIGQNGQVVSQPRVNASFISRAVGDFKPEASFDIEFMVQSINPVLDRDGVEVDPPKLSITTIVPQYTSPNASAPNVDVVPLFAVSPGVIDAINNYWEAESCYRAHGRLNFSSRTEEIVSEGGFGEPQRSIRTINVSEFIITGGSEAALDGDLAFDIDEIRAGIAARKARIEESKTNKKSAKTVPAQNTSKGKLDLGF